MLNVLRQIIDIHKKHTNLGLTVVMLWADCYTPGSSVHGILQARILESLAISFSRGSS